MAHTMRNHKHDVMFDREISQVNRLRVRLEARERVRAQKLLLLRQDATLDIQRTYRAHRGRKEARSARSLRAVTLIQRIWRIKVARWHLDQDRGIVPLWREYKRRISTWRRIDRNKSDAEQAKRMDVCLAVHGRYRKALPSRLMEAKIACIQSAATRIQSAWRAMQSRLEREQRATARKLAMWNNKAFIIQTAWASHRILILAILKQDHDAAVCIQRVAMGRAARRAVAILRVERREREKKRRKLEEMIAMRDALKTPPTPPQRRFVNRLSVREDYQRKKFREQSLGFTAEPRYLAKKNASQVKRRRTAMAHLQASAVRTKKGSKQQSDGDSKMPQKECASKQQQKDGHTVESQRRDRRSHSIFDTIEEEKQKTAYLAALEEQLSEQISEQIQHKRGEVVETDDFVAQLTEQERKRFYKRTREMAVIPPDQIEDAERHSNDKPTTKPKPVQLLPNLSPPSAAVSASLAEWQQKEAEEKQMRMEEEERKDRRRREVEKMEKERRHAMKFSAAKKKADEIQAAVRDKEIELEQRFAELEKQMAEEDQGIRNEAEQEAKLIKQQLQLQKHHRDSAAMNCEIGVTTTSIVVEASRPLSARPPYME